MSKNINLKVKDFKWQYFNWYTCMEAIKIAHRLNNNEVFFKNRVGDIHRVQLNSVNPYYAGNTDGNILELKVNNVLMGAKIRDYGEAYDFIKSCVEER